MSAFMLGFFSSLQNLQPAVAAMAPPEVVAADAPAKEPDTGLPQTLARYRAQAFLLIAS
jgi:hypothetical protein